MSIFYKKEEGRNQINIGDKIEVTIENSGEKGHGVANHSGYTIMIPGTKKGEKLNIIITKIKKNYAMAKRLEKENLEKEIKKEETDLKKPLKEKRGKKGDYENESYQDFRTDDQDNMGYSEGEDSTDISDGEYQKH